MCNLTLQQCRDKEPEIFGGSKFLDLIYADDVASIFAHGNAIRIHQITRRNAEIIKQILSTMELLLSFPKSYNFFIPPGLFRRVPNPRRRSNLDCPLPARQTATKPNSPSKNGILESRIFPPEFCSRSPCVWEEAIRILGIPFDPQLTYSKHIETLIRLARVRTSIMSSLARSSWGIKVSILRATRNALLVSLARYGYVTVRSGAYEGELVQLETRHTNIAARRVLGLEMTARFEALFVTAD